MLAQSQHLPNIVRSSHMRLRGCCDISKAALESCQERFSPDYTATDYRAIADDSQVELVVVATTEKDRVDLIRVLAAAGKAIYVEKPLANSLDELSTIESIVRQAGIPFCVGHNRRCAPAAISAYETFRRHMETPNTLAWRFDREGDARPQMPDAAATGVSIRINDDWFSWKAWAMDKRHAPHGPMLFEMTHFTDLCNWYMACTPVEVVALEGGLLNHGVVIRYASGGVATIMMSAVGTFGYPKELYELMGNGGIVVVDHLLEVRTAGIADEPPVRKFPMLNDRHPAVGGEGGLAGWLAKKRAACEEAAASGDAMLQFTAEPDKGHYRALEAFVDEICGARPPVCDINAAASATRVALAAAKSVATGRAVKLNQLA